MKYGILTNVIFMMKKIYHFDKAAFFGCFLFALGMYLTDLISVYTDKYVVELAAAGFEARLIIICAGLILGSYIFHYVMNMSSSYFNGTGFGKITDSLYAEIMRKNMTTDYENNEKAEVNDALNKARDGIRVATINTCLNIRGTVRYIFNFFTYSAILSMLDIRLVPIVVIPAALSFFIQRHKMMWVWNMSGNWQNYERQINYVQSVGKDFSYAKDVRIFGMQTWLEAALNRSFLKRLNWLKQQDAWEFRHNLLESFVLFLGDFAAYGYAIYMVVQGGISAGDFVLYFNSIMRLSETIRDWCDNMSGYQWISNNINYVRAYLETEDKTNRGKGKPVPEKDCEIEFKNVSYAYFGAEKPTINNISFTLHKGEKLALVGLNGAGKTTLVKLMCGIYEPTGGEILLNGVPVNEYNREEYFGLFSTVFQDLSSLAASVSENLTGKTAENIDRAKMFDCMRKAGIYDKIMSLPQKEETPLVRGVYENAAELSGGETQKLALAKALYKDAPVLLLDEPTAALDPIAEQEMYLRYADFSKGKSSVFISHRLASTRFCDRIMLIENGVIAEMGTHSELMETNGKYAELYNLQSSYYNDNKTPEEEI